jgi:DNA-binding HxlR family transcriptional regulator
MVLLDLIGRRWTLRVLWELRGGPMTFRALQERCDDVSPSVLNTRISELKKAGLLASGEEGYALTADAVALSALLLPLDAWARRWADRRRP